MTSQYFLTKSSTADDRIYLGHVGDQHRKRFGQYFTPREVADFMVGWVMESGHPSLYDPAFGLGNLYDPVIDDDHVAFSASEIDPSVLNYWENATGRSAVFVEREDYLLSWGEQHTNIVCNPPYMRFQKFLNRDDVFSAFVSNTGIRLSGYTNTASAFLMKSLSEMDGKGRLAYIMPLEFLNTGYGDVVKAKLIDGSHLAAIIKLECEKEIFPDAITSVGIILYDAAVSHQKVDFYSINSIGSLATVLESTPTTRVASAELTPNAKWLRHFTVANFSMNTDGLFPLSHYGRFSRGIATGANKFFVMKPSTAKAANLDASEYTPCLTRSTQAMRAVFSQSDFEELARKDAPVLLFSAGANHSAEAERYIRFGEINDYHKRFLTKSRKPWYKTESRSPAPILIGVFSRGGYKVIRNRSSLLNLSCFHGFNPNIYGLHYVDHLYLYLASEPGRAIVSLSNRKYGDSLDKFEPNDLNEALVPSQTMFDRLDTEAIDCAMEYIEENGSVPEYINAFFGAELAGDIE